MSERDRLILRQKIARARAAQSNPQRNPDGTYGQPPEGMVMNPNTGQMTSRELLKNNMEVSRPGAAGMGYMQGYTLNAADEGMGAAGGDFARESFRAKDELAQEQYPGAYFGGQLTGNVVSPVTKVAGPVRTVRGATALAAAEGGVDAFNRGEGSAAERAPGAAAGGATSALFGLGTAGLVKGGSKGFQRLFQRSEERPTVELLKATKNAAYHAVEKAGINFSPDEMGNLYQRVQQVAANADFDDIADPHTAAALRIFERRSGEEVSLKRLDKLRQSLWSRYNRSDEPMILDMIGEIDGLIASRADGNELMQNARLANSRYAKAELLENALHKARLQTASTGSGGNILNKYRQALTRIVTNPNEKRWFSPEEIQLMERFIEGEGVENSLRRVGKLSPGGNGLMTALNVYAASIDPTLLTITGVGAGAKKLADRSAMQGSERIRDAVATGIMPTDGRPSIRLGEAAAGVSVAGPELLRNRDGR